jgi:Putative adhesin
MPAFTTPEPIAATVEVAGARVRVTASDRTDSVVLVEPIDAASRLDVRVASKTKVDFADGRLSVKTTTSGDKSGSVAITIDLPAGSSLAAHLAYSSVQADGPLGPCELQLASGQVQLDRIDALQANIASGEVTVGHIAGRATVDSASGDFEVGRADGSVTATTASGAIRIGRMARGQARLKNGSGNIEVGISEGAAASVDASSERGAVHDFVSSAGQPDPSDDKVMVHARTRHGDIIIQRVAG